MCRNYENDRKQMWRRQTRAEDNNMNFDSPAAMYVPTLKYNKCTEPGVFPIISEVHVNASDPIIPTILSDSSQLSDVYGHVNGLSEVR